MFSEESCNKIRPGLEQPLPDGGVEGVFKGEQPQVWGPIRQVVGTYMRHVRSELTGLDNTLNVEDKEGEAKMASHFPYPSGEKESQRWEIFGAKDGKSYFMLREHIYRIISPNTVFSPFHSKISPKSKNCFTS